jgi:hypothetical protein
MIREIILIYLKSVPPCATNVTYFLTPYILTLGDVSMIKEDTKRVVSYVSKDIYKELLKEAKYEDRTISKMVEKILKDHYKIKDDD